MYNIKIRVSTNENSGYEATLDDLDFRIISLLITGHENKNISDVLKVPLSTIQRRVRNIMMSGIVTMKILPNFKRLGIKKGLIHIYLRNGDIKESTSRVAKMNGFLSASVHVGNSDIVGDFVYEDSEQLVDAISDIKHMDGVDRVLWSEEIFKLPSHKENIIKSFQKYWQNNKNNNNHNNSKYRNNKDNNIRMNDSNGSIRKK